MTANQTVLQAWTEGYHQILVAENCKPCEIYKKEWIMCTEKHV